MIGNSAFIAGMILLVATFVALEQVTFLASYKRLLFDQYWGWLLAFAGVLYVNLFAGSYLLSRRLFLKETGRKLAHLERQLQSGDSIVRDLSERLAAEE
jgi:hypothetical protein